MLCYRLRARIQIAMAISAILACCFPSSALEPNIRVGIAKVDVSPDYPILLNGFLVRQQESLGVRQEIWAKALCIEADGHAPLLLITVDTLGIPDSLWKAVQKQLEPLGIQQRCLAITATHTHSAPIINNCANNILGRDFTQSEQQHIDQYTVELTEKLIKVGQQALENRQPAKLSWTVGTASFAKNRRSSTGPIDHQLPLLAVHDPSGKLLAVYVSYACHCVTLAERMVSGDWAGYAQENIESQQPDCVALVSIGCGGDQNPNSLVGSDRIDLANGQGKQIADEVGRLLGGALTPLVGSVSAASEVIRLPLIEIPTKPELSELAEQDNPIGYHARKQLSKLNRGEVLNDSIDYPIQVWTIGDKFNMVFLAGEVTVEYGLRIKAARPNSVWVNAYSNACPCYIPSENVLQQGGYEGRGAMIYYDQAGVIKTGVEQLIIEETERLLR